MGRRVKRKVGKYAIGARTNPNRYVEGVIGRPAHPTPLFARANPVDADLAAILKISREHNPAEGITGLLCFTDGVYVQVLEGGRNAVNARYKHIVQDRRHHDVILLGYEEITERAFPGWTMGQVNLHRLNPALVLKYSESGNTLRIQWIHEPEPPWKSSRVGFFGSSPQTCHIILPPFPIGTWMARDLAATSSMCSSAVRPSGMRGTAE